jgi:hypothetical protein
MKNGDINFDKFRKDRRHRRAQFGGVPATEAKANGLRDAEAYEERQVHETRLTRDVHDFLAQATRQAAAIVEKVTQAAEVETTQRLSREVQEFLQETMRRAASFLRLVQAGKLGTGTRDVEAHVSNLLGEALDSFRFEGTAQVADKHIGQNPFLVDHGRDDGEDSLGEDAPEELDAPSAEVAPPAPEPKVAPAERKAPAKPVETHDVTAAARVSATPDAPPRAEASPEAKPVTAAAASAGCPSLDALLGGDIETLKRALKALVKAEVMTQEQAREIYRADLAARAPVS